MVYVCNKAINKHNNLDEAHDGAGSVGPLVGGKRDLWEGGIRVPGWIHWPGKIWNNVVSEKLTTIMDFPVTIMNAALVENAALIGKTTDGGKCNKRKRRQ